MTARDFVRDAPRYVFFTGKGGVGKTSLSCATAIALADGGKRVLLVSTDPASNLDEVLGARLSALPTPVPGVERLSALNIDPARAASEYRERVVGPYRDVLPAAAVKRIEEQLSGACTMEIAAFNEFSKMLGSPGATSKFDHIIFDTAPTGHTLRLLGLPAAWSGYIEMNPEATSCLGPLAGLSEQRALYASTVDVLADGTKTIVALVSRPERSALTEAERTYRELFALGVSNQRLILNGVFRAADQSDPVARSLAVRGELAIENIPEGLSRLSRLDIPLFPVELLGVAALRLMLSQDTAIKNIALSVPISQEGIPAPGLFRDLISELAGAGRGVIMTMGKGGVGKTTIASVIAVELARRGHRVHLTTTDPAAHVDPSLARGLPGLDVSRIDPAAETEAYRKEVIAAAGSRLDDDGRRLLEEDLRSPCTEEIAVFRAFARKVNLGASQFVVLDTAPTGHTLLLLDAAKAYHREVIRSLSDLPEAVRRLLPRLRDRAFTRILIVTLPEATPVHEAAQLQSDLARAGIEPFAWVINQSLSPLSVWDLVLRTKQQSESKYIREVREKLAARSVLVPWMITEPRGLDGLGAFLGIESQGSV